MLAGLVMIAPVAVAGIHMNISNNVYTDITPFIEWVHERLWFRNFCYDYIDYIDACYFYCMAVLPDLYNNIFQTIAKIRIHESAGCYHG